MRTKTIKVYCDICKKEIKKGSTIKQIGTLLLIMVGALEEALVRKTKTDEEVCEECYKSYENWRERRKRKWLETKQ